jgi:hypothetical protein
MGLIITFPDKAHNGWVAVILDPGKGKSLSVPNIKCFGVTDGLTVMYTVAQNEIADYDRTVGHSRQRRQV